MTEKSGQPPSEMEVSAIRKAITVYVQDNGEDIFLEEDVQRLLTDDYYVHRFFMHVAEEPGDDQVQRAVDMIKTAFTWRNKWNPKSITSADISPSLKMKGGLFLHNKDKDGKPMLVFCIRRHTKQLETMEEMKNFFHYFLERVDRETNDGQLTVVFECAGCGLRNMDLELVQYMINLFKYYYPYCLNYILVLEMPWVFNAAWKLIKSWLPAAGVRKIKFLNKSNISEYVDKDQQLVEWGGTDDWEYEFEEEGTIVANENDEPSLPNGFEPSAPVDISCVNGNAAGDERKTSKVQFASSANDSTMVHSFSADCVSSQMSANEDEGQTPGPPMSKRSLSATSSLNSVSLTSSSKTLLSLTPGEEVVFDASRASGAMGKVEMKNISSQPLVFKIKTTSPEKYRVRPSLSFIGPGDTCHVEIYVHPAQLVPTTEGSPEAPSDGSVTKCCLSKETAASLMKDKFLVTVLSIQPDSEGFEGGLCHSKLAEIMKKHRPEAEYRLRCSVVGFGKLSSVLKQSGQKEISASSSTLASANKQLESLSKKVSSLCRTMSELQDSVVSLKKVNVMLFILVLLSQLTLFYFLLTSPNVYHSRMNQTGVTDLTSAVPDLTSTVPDLTSTVPNLTSMVPELPSKEPFADNVGKDQEL